jgi:peptidoglycan/xylan/chitin deacetylase (PgdA/CDA1 family)
MQTEVWSPAPAALTFDDGSDPVWTSLVLDALTNAGAQATFFVVAPRATRYPSLISSMRRAVVAGRGRAAHAPGGDARRSVRPDRRLGDPVLLYEGRDARNVKGLRARAGQGSTLLAVHWRRETKTYPLRGDEVHELLLGRTRLHNSKTIVESDYRLNLFEDPA